MSGKAEGERFVALPDSHGCWIDWQAASAALEFVRFYRPSKVILLGDHVDFEQFSRFDSDPRVRTTVTDDIDACGAFLSGVRAASGSARLLYLEGNHEARLRRYLWTRAAELIGLKGMNVAEVLGLAKHRIEYAQSGSARFERLLFKHGNMVRSRSGYTAAGEMDRSGLSGVSGHTHRLGQVYRTHLDEMLTWAEAGCLCRFDLPYLQGQHPDWQHGLAYGWMSSGGQSFTLHTAPIINGRLRYDGHVIEGAKMRPKQGRK